LNDSNPLGPRLIQIHASAGKLPWRTFAGFLRMTGLRILNAVISRSSSKGFYGEI
jgi:hypothetical protein